MSRSWRGGLLCLALATAATPGLACAEDEEETICLTQRAALNLFSVVYGEGSRVGVDPAPPNELSTAVITTGDGEDVELAWTSNAPLFVEESNRRVSQGKLVSEAMSIHNNGIHSRIIEMPDGQWQAHHGWMDLDNTMRLAIATSFDRERAEQLVSLLSLARDNGIFGTHAWVGGPMPDPDGFGSEGNQQ